MLVVSSISLYFFITELHYSIDISVCLEEHSASHRGVPPGIGAFRARECLQASAGGIRLNKEGIHRGT